MELAVLTRIRGRQGVIPRFFGPSSLTDTVVGGVPDTTLIQKRGFLTLRHLHNDVDLTPSTLDGDR